MTWSDKRCEYLKTKKVSKHLSKKKKKKEGERLNAHTHTKWEHHNYDHQKNPTTQHNHKAWQKQSQKPKCAENILKINDWLPQVYRPTWCAVRIK